MRTSRRKSVSGGGVTGQHGEGYWELIGILISGIGVEIVNTEEPEIRACAYRPSLMGKRGTSGKNCITMIGQVGGGSRECEAEGG